MVTGYDEAIAVYHDNATWSACNAVAGWQFPVPLEGDDVSDLIEQHRDELVFSEELPAMARGMTPARLVSSLRSATTTSTDAPCPSQRARVSSRLPGK